MRLSLPKSYTKALWRAIVEFDLIQPNDKILLGFSGGKDSAFLSYALAVLQKSAPIPFQVEGYHLDMGYDPNFDYSDFYRFFEELEIPFHVEHTQIKDIVFAETEKSACARCAYFRRGAVNNYARSRGCNKVAYAHHYDDAVETFLMSILYSGRISTFMPSTYLTESQVTVIRPLVYLREKDIRETRKFVNFEPVANPCPMAGRTKRAEVKGLLRDLSRENKMVFFNVAAAMCDGTIGDLWPERLNEAKMAEKMKGFWALKNSKTYDVTDDSAEYL